MTQRMGPDMTDKEMAHRIVAGDRTWRVVEPRVPRQRDFDQFRELWYINKWARDCVFKEE